MEGVIGEIKKQGAVIIDPADLESHGKFDDTELTVLLYELKADLNSYLATRGPESRVHSLKEIIEFNDHNAEKEMPYFGQDLFIKAEAKGPSDQRRISGRVGSEPAAFAARRNRWSNGQASSGCHSRADWRSGMAHGFSQWRSLHRRQLKRGCRGGLSQYQCARRIRVRNAGRDFFFWPGMERTDSAQNRLQLRTGYQGQETSTVSAQCKDMREYKAKTL